MAETDLERADLADPRTFVEQDLPALFRELRRSGPVHWNPGRDGLPGFWAITRYSDVVAVYRDPARFTSEYGNVLAVLRRGFDPASGRMIAVTDGARHRALRGLLQNALLPRLHESARQEITEHIRTLLSGVLGTGPFDFVDAVADRIPITTIGNLMDLPVADRPQLVEWNNRHLSSDDPDAGADQESPRSASLLYFAELAGQRRSAPGDDLLSALVSGHVDRQPLSTDEIVFNCYSLVFGADLSSRMAATGAMLALAEHPEQWRALRDGEVGVSTATEELLRWTTPAMHFGRRCVADVELRGQQIRAGDIVTLWNTSANRDEEVFHEPDRLDLSRDPNRQITFGHGPHFCLGAAIGRLHLSALLEALRELVTEIRVVEQPRRLYSNFLYGYRSAPLELVARR